MPEYNHLKTYAEQKAKLRGGLQLTRSQVELIFDLGSTVNLEYVETDMSLDRVIFHFSEESSTDNPKLSYHVQGATTVMEFPTDAELLSLLEAATAKLREKLTPTE